MPYKDPKKRKEWSRKNASKVAANSKKHYAKNKDEIKKTKKEYYKKNKNEILKKRIKYRKDNPEKLKNYNDSYRSIKSDIIYQNQHYDYHKRLDERKLTVSEEDLKILHDAVRLYCIKYNADFDEELGEGYCGMLIALRNLDENKGKYRTTFLKRSIVFHLMKNYNSQTLSSFWKKGIQHISLDIKDENDISLHEIIEDKTESVTYNSDYLFFRSLVKKGFDNFVKLNRSKYSGQFLFEIWEDFNIHLLTHAEVCEKRNLKKKQIENLYLTKVKPAFANIKKQIQKDYII